MKMNRRSSPFDGYVRRLLQSSNPVERDSIYYGYTLHHQYPVVVPLGLHFEHMHILGAPGTGKSALGVAPLATQLIRRNDGPVIIIDLKGDMALFNTARIESDNAGRTFKWFTNKPYRSTYIFNPWRQSYLERLTLQEILGLFLVSLNMHHGDDYGRAFFGLKSRTFLQEALKAALDLEASPVRNRRRHDGLGVPQSFADLEAILRRISQNRDDQLSNELLVHVLQSLVDFPQLNMSPSPHANNVAVQNAIHMPEVIRDKQVIYFFLQALMDTTTVAEIARLVVYSALSAALAFRDETNTKPRVYLIVDEAQILIAQNISNVLAQSREFGLACILVHQSLSQLNPPGGVDLREMVISSTSIKQFWSARHPAEKDHISKISGEVGYYSAAWDQPADSVIRGEIGRRYADSAELDPTFIRVSESVGPRLSSQDIEDYSRQPNTSIMSIERNAGLSRFQGAFPVHMDWIMSETEFTRRNLEMEWPPTSDETVSTTGVWPKIDTSFSAINSNDENNSHVEDIAQPDHVANTPEKATQNVTEKLDKLQADIIKRRRKKK